MAATAVMGGSAMASQVTVESNVVELPHTYRPNRSRASHWTAVQTFSRFGGLAYEMIAGRRAFSGETKVSIQAAILNQEPKPARPPDRARYSERGGKG